MYKENCISIILFNQKKTAAIGDNMDEPGRHFAK
jgi:hypothetical protein